MRNQTLAWAVVFVEHGLPFHFYAEEWEARAVCNAINSGDTGDTDYGECRVVPLCEARMEYDAEHRQEDNTQPESAYVALRNMSVRLKTPTMNNYPEIGDIKHVMEEAVMEWSTDEEKEMVKIFCEQNQKHLTDLWRLNDIPIFQNNPKAEYHLDKACYHLIMVQNCFWDQHFNYGRIMREKRESELQEKNKSKSLLDTLKKILMLWRWEE